MSELKQIAEIVQGLGEQATLALIIWVIADTLKSVMFWVAVLYGVYLVTMKAIPLWIKRVNIASNAGETLRSLGYKHVWDSGGEEYRWEKPEGIDDTDEVPG